MKTIKVNLGERSYDIVIGRGILKLLPAYLKKLGAGSDAYIITNPFIRDKYARPIANILKKNRFALRFRIIPDSEKSKSIATAMSILKDIAAYDDKKRAIFIIAIGGGVTGDLSGFVASLYKRGIPYIQIPTTLLAQVDSSIGGKTAVDLKQGKNLVGAFYQPRLVFSDTSTLESLTLRQLRSGFAEVIKYAVIKDGKLFAYLEKNYPDILTLKMQPLESIVESCARIKADIIQRDEMEKKSIRTMLNFGHTIGHAIEAAANYKGYNHGEAIALGMVAASNISLKLGLISDVTAQRIEGLIKKIGLPVRIKKIPAEAIIKAHYRDKKFIGSKNRFVLINGIGKVSIVENVPLGIIKEVLQNLAG